MTQRLLRTAAVAALAVVPIVAFGPTSAFASSPHFIGTPTDYATASGNSVVLSADFKAAGLGDVGTASFTLSATASGTFGCFTRKGNHPQASNKEGPTVITGYADVPVRNGSTHGTVSATLGSSLDCPGGQHLVAIDWSFTNVWLSGPYGLATQLSDVSGP